MTEEQIFLAALDLANTDHRSAYLDSACGTGTELRRQVEELLAAHFKSGEFLNEPIAKQLGTSPLTQIAETVVVDREPGFTPGVPDEAAMARPHERDADANDLSFLSPSSRPDSLGRLGHYEILEVLGRGGFGIVFRAFDDVLQRVVALKVLAPAIAATSPARKRFLREAQASARVHHENVVQVHAVEELPIPYLVMEFIAGETLQARLDRNGPLDAQEIVRLARQVAEGLAAAHETGLIHRDIKPGNILIGGGAQERVKITDFGLARAADDASMTQSGMVAGTPMFMAPEQAQGDTLDQRADLFSLGSVMYVMASGRPPFRAATTFAVLKRVVEETPRPIKDIIPETPQWLCDIIERLQEKKPEKRFQSAREVADVLADCEEQLKQHARVQDLSRIPRPAAASSGNWKWVALAVVLLPLILAATEYLEITRMRSVLQPVAAEAKAKNVTPVSTASESEGWVQLFNRKDLTGLKTHPDQRGAWEVKNGILVGSKVASYLFSEEGKYENFHLRLEVKINRGGDSGIFFRSPFTMRPGRTADSLRPAGGYEVELHRNRAYQVPTGSIWNAEKVGAPKLLSKAADLSLTEVDEWVTLEIIARDNHFLTKVNGTQTAESDDPDGAFRKGHFALQVLNPQTIVQFRKIEIKELPPSSQSLPPTFANSIGMEFVKVPKGKSWLGGSKDKPGDRDVEIPADFYLGKYEVTQEEWAKVMGENPSWFSRNGGGKDAVKDIPDADLKRFPVENITWDQCQAFVAKLNVLEQQAGWVYRLPTLDEWEYACRGGPMSSGKLGSDFDFFFAQPSNTLPTTQANFSDGGTTEDPAGLRRTCLVGTYQSNSLGLFDMHGNIQEWCDDKQLGADEMPHPVFRGGSYKFKAAYCSASARMSGWADTRFSDLGLRLARVPAGASPEAKAPRAADVLKDAVLRMNFEQDTFYERDGKTYVRDLSGNGNDGLCENVEFGRDGKTGGGLLCKEGEGRLELAKSLIKGQPNYTITAWCRWDERTVLGSGTNLYRTCLPKHLTQTAVFNIGIPPERSVVVNAWNLKLPPNKNWKSVATNARSVPAGWFFMAVSLTDGEIDKGKLRIVIDDKIQSLTSQMVATNDPSVDVVGYNMAGAVIDELAVFQRALLDEEIAAVRAAGLRGASSTESLALPPTFTNNIGMEFVKVPQGKSWLGGEKDKPGDKEVEIAADFYLGKYEVTQEEWEKVMGENPSHFSRNGGGKDNVQDISDADLKRFPVDNVSWNRCQAFVARLNRLENETRWIYRLPTEAEWEYACRGGPMVDKAVSDFDFFFDRQASVINPDHLRFLTNAEGRPGKVGSYVANRLGLYDMHGSMWEWCDDMPADSPQVHFRKPDESFDRNSVRMIRGGSFGSPQDDCRATSRHAHLQSDRADHFGLRVARVPAGAPSPAAK